MRRVRPGVAAVHDTVAVYRADWERANAEARDGDGPLWLVLGDSTGQAIGASAPTRGYVGQLRRRLEARDGRPWRVLNAAVSGARFRDVARDQLGWLTRFAGPPALVTCAVGSNDVVRPWGIERARRNLRRVLDALPAGALVATIPKGLSVSRTAALNADIWELAPSRRLVVADVWAHTGPPWAAKVAVDYFHPNDRGYEDWTAAFAEALDLPAASL